MSEFAKKKQHEVSFVDNTYSPIILDEGSNLSRHLTATNSPILFGCRIGICGTCLSQIISVQSGILEPPSEHELDLLEVIAPGNPKARLACQINLTTSFTIAPLEEEP